MAAAWMNDPRWNLDLTSTVTSTLVETATASVSTAISTSTSKSTPPTIPLSTLVFRPGYEMEKASGAAGQPPFAFNPLILRFREAVNAWISGIANGSAGAFVDLVMRGAKTLTWVVAVVVTGYIALEVGWALHKSYHAARALKDPTSGPVLPTDPLDPIGIPVPPDLGPPPGSKPVSSRRDIRVKLFSEILAGYLTLILGVSMLLGDSVILQFLLSGLTGFVGMVAVMLPDEAEWSRRLYNYNEGGFEMRSILVQPGDDAYRPEDVRDVKAANDTVEIGTCMRGGIRTGRVVELADKTEEKLKEVRDKVAERIHDATAATRKMKEALTQKPVAASVATPQITITRDTEENSLLAPANEDLKAQLSRVMAPVKDILDTDRTIEQASKKVEAWLMKAGDAFDVDDDLEDDSGKGKGIEKAKDRRPSFISGEGERDGRDAQNGSGAGSTLRLR
ncbi:hypothetical protein TWF696_005421 [Orbilia brochopaga]|uniref:Uncharacterized protein n=1 Tax=Orbilia brochopaga TaxID=3140254 RepID=A0AAV9V411_9PEZI